MTNLVENEVIFGHGFDDGILDLILIVEDHILESAEVVDGAGRVRQSAVCPADDSRSALDFSYDDVGGR